MESDILATFTAEYDSLKSEQSGVIGWFKRKLPFTETRKQELKHRGSVDWPQRAAKDQKLPDESELLAVVAAIKNQARPSLRTSKQCKN